MPGDIVIEKKHIYGEWRRAVNVGLDDKGSIHEDATAKKVGMRGGAVVGFLNLNLFPPILLKTFGRRWFERGSISMFYTYALTHGEEVRVVMGILPKGVKDTQVEAWAETRDGHTVLKGTASVGEPEELPHLHTLELKDAEPAELRMLAGLKTGEEFLPRDMLVTQAGLNKTLEFITEPLDWYKGGSPWGGAIVPPSDVARLMQCLPWGGISILQSDMSVATPVHPENVPEAVQVQGAIEIRNRNGPVKVGVPYIVTGKLVCVGVSAKTEYIWYDSCLEEKDSGKLVATTRQMLRFMKASSPLYR